MRCLHNDNQDYDNKEKDNDNKVRNKHCCLLLGRWRLRLRPKSRAGDSVTAPRLVPDPTDPNQMEGSFIQPATEHGSGQD